MSRKVFTKMETESADDMLFGETKHPVKLGLDQVAGGGVVYPNIKVAPAEGSEETIDGLEATSKNIAFAACQRAADIGLPAIQIETEHVQQQSISREASERCTAVTWEQLEELHD
ncbi:MAG: methanol--corrinoid methyltransferase, partial [Methanosphaera stadtmanae]|nr:methanol--corrinoid methyltransferase [Methanosphaera stadtmanae]